MGAAMTSNEFSESEAVERALMILKQDIEKARRLGEAVPEHEPTKSELYGPVSRYRDVASWIKNCPTPGEVSRSLIAVKDRAATLQAALYDLDDLALNALRSVGLFSRFEKDALVIDFTGDRNRIRRGESSKIGLFLTVIETAARMAADVFDEIHYAGGKNPLLKTREPLNPKDGYFLNPQAALVAGCVQIYLFFCPYRMKTTEGSSFRIFVAALHSIAVGNLDASDCEDHVKKLVPAAKRRQSHFDTYRESAAGLRAQLAMLENEKVKLDFHLNGSEVHHAGSEPVDIQRLKAAIADIDGQIASLHERLHHSD